MLIIENVLVALQSLRTNPLRSVLTLIGIAVGIAAVLYVVTLGEMTKKRINDRLQAMGSNVLTIRPEFSRSRGVSTSANVVNLKIKDAEEIEQTSQVITATVPEFGGGAVAEYRDKNWNTRIVGTLPARQYVNNDHPVEGRFFNDAEVNERARVVVLGANVHKELFGTASPIGETVLLNSKHFEVIGLLSTKGEGWGSPDDQVFMPLTTAQERMFGVEHLSSIMAQIRSPRDYNEALFDIEAILRRNHRLRADQENDFEVRRQDLFLSTIQETNTEIANFIVIIALVSLVVGGIGIANIMLVSVTERTREIGVRRAIGAKRVYIILQFLTEAMMLGVMGGALGILAGTVFNRINIGEQLIFPWLWIINSFLICASIGVLAGLYPAFRAANANVIESLRYE
ncbi:MAG TPA: ABC transporter permease [bacterium]